MAWVAPAAMIVGTVLSYSSSRKASKAAEQEGAHRQAAANIEAAHMEQQATLSIAAAQRQMLDERRQARLLQSRALAVAGASGAGAGDKTVVDIIGDIGAEGAYRQSVALYEGLERSRELRVGAQIRRMGGDLQAEYGRGVARAHEISGVANLFQGVGTLAARYAPRGSLGSGTDIDA